MEGEEKESTLFQSEMDDDDEDERQGKLRECFVDLAEVRFLNFFRVTTSSLVDCFKQKL